MISARIIADSVNQAGNRLTTFVCKYPRFIHAELLTHRDKSRNSASSRAIPVKKMLGLVISEPVYPVYWGQNQKGMQASTELSGWRRWLAPKIWRASCYTQVGYAWILSRLGVHKQVANRLIEPFAHMTVIISGTEWGNFFNLRAHKDAQPEFQALAYAMLDAYATNVARYLRPGEWHLPFCESNGMPFPYEVKDLLKIATARCARVSYLNFEGKIDVEKDFKLHDDLLASGHMSPFEHCARAESGPVKSGNFVGYTQYRKLLPNECRSEFDAQAILATKKGKNAESNHLA